MGRIKIELPEKFRFSTNIPVRITDLNYGKHVGNDAILSIIHEARMQFLKSLDYSEMDFAGVGMIMADVGIEFKNELFYGETIIISVEPGELSKVSFDLLYKMEKKTEGEKIIIAIAKTGMVCYDYDKKKIVAIPEEAQRKLKS